MEFRIELKILLFITKLAYFKDFIFGDKYEYFF